MQNSRETCEGNNIGYLMEFQSFKMSILYILCKFFTVKDFSPLKIMKLYTIHIVLELLGLLFCKSKKIREENLINVLQNLTYIYIYIYM